MQIVYATDGSPGAAAAADFLSRLRLNAEDRILLVSAAQRGRGEGRQSSFTQEMETLGRSPARCETRERAGQPAEEILACAREVRADLIVVGAMGRPTFSRWFIGSTAERVVRQAETDVLVARPVRCGLQRAVVAVDSSPTAKSVAAVAVLFPLPEGTELCFTTVLPPPEEVMAVAPVFASMPQELDTALHDPMEAAEARLRDLARVAGDARRPISAQVLRGEPESALLAAADREETDLIILGSHGESGLNHLLLGRVSERISRQARCSVLVVR